VDTLTRSRWPDRRVPQHDPAQARVQVAPGPEDALPVTQRLSRRFAGSASISTWGSFLVRAMPLLVLPPFVSRLFPTPEAALWFVLITLQGLQLLLESSVGMTFIRSIGFVMGGATQLRDHRQAGEAGKQAQPNMNLMSRLWSVMRSLYGYVGLITLLFIGVLGAASAPTLIQQMDNPREGWGAIAVFVVGAGLRAYGGLYISYLYGIGRIALLRWWEAVFWGLATISSLAVLLAGGSLLAVALAYQIPLLGNLFWNALLVRKDQNRRRGFERVGGIDREVLTQVWPGMWRTGLGVALFLGVTQGAGLYYAKIGPAEQVASYLFAMSLMRPMMQFAQVPFITKLPILAEYQVKAERLEQVKLAQRGMLLSHSLLALMVLAAAVVLPVFAKAGGATDVPLLLWVAIGVAAYLERIGSMHLQFYSQTNHILLHWANGGAAILFAIFAWFLLPHLGVLAFPLALCLALLLFYVPYSMWHSYQAFGLSFPRYELRTSAVPLLLMLSLLLLLGVYI